MQATVSFSCNYEYQIEDPRVPMEPCPGPPRIIRNEFIAPPTCLAPAVPFTLGLLEVIAIPKVSRFSYQVLISKKYQLL